MQGSITNVGVVTENVQKSMGPKIIATGAHCSTEPNFLIIRMKQWSAIYRLPADVWMGIKCCSISKNLTISYIDK